MVSCGVSGILYRLQRLILETLKIVLLLYLSDTNSKNTGITLAQKPVHHHDPTKLELSEKYRAIRGLVVDRIP